MAYRKVSLRLQNENLLFLQGDAVVRRADKRAPHPGKSRPLDIPDGINREDEVIERALEDAIEQSGTMICRQCSLQVIDEGDEDSDEDDDEDYDEENEDEEEEQKEEDHADEDNGEGNIVLNNLFNLSFNKS